jgi:hypothetical protein
MKNIKEIIEAMFLEGTGKALCDSGDAYGRHWQKNQKLGIDALMNAPAVTWEGDYYSISTLHYLLNQPLEIDSYCEKFNKLNINGGDWSDDYYGVCDKAKDYLEGLEDFKAKATWNTYNGETSLTQVLQGQNIEIDGDNYVLLQLHQGCDVRGGYTDARLFKIGDEGYLYPEDVYGSVTKIDGSVISVDNMYNGHSITDENGKDVDIVEGDKVELELMTR